MNNTFKAVIHLRINGFERSAQKEPISQLYFDAVDVNEWFNSFVRRAVSSINNDYFPVYRMADGEFVFCTEMDKSEHESIARAAVKSMEHALHRLIPIIRSKSHALKTCWGENYSSQELKGLTTAFPQYLRDLSHKGVLAIHFTRTAGKFAEEFIEPMCAWFDRHDIALNTSNYVSFYFVYALLRGPERYKIFRDRRVLIVTWLDDERKVALLNGLAREGVRNVQFLPISSDKSMLDRIDLSSVSQPIDVALVGAGIGSANILAQLEPLNTLCIDAGFCIDCIIEPSLASKRAFCSPDMQSV